MRTLMHAVLGLAPFLLAPALAAQTQPPYSASFIGLGHLPGGDGSMASGVSADGSVVVGEATSLSGLPEAFRWENGVMTGLGLLPGGHSTARGVSADGSVVVGQATSFSGLPEAFRWENGVMTGVGFLPGGIRSGASGVSADGSVVVGGSSTLESGEAFRWENGVMTGLGSSPTRRTGASGVSADGSVVVGVERREVNCRTCIPTSMFDAFRWESGLMTDLGNLPGQFNSGALAVSGDGSVVVGWSDWVLLIASEAFRWEAGVMIGLGLLATGDSISEAVGVSADGSVVVGWSGTRENKEAFIWDETNGMRNLRDVLVNERSLDLSGWTLSEATAISADGSTIVGWGINPSHLEEGWIAVVPEPSSALLGGVGLAVVAVLATISRRSPNTLRGCRR